MLRLADGRFKYTEGMIENVPLRTRSQFFAVDFHVMEFEEDTEDALILGRPFLHTAHAEISCRTGRVTLRAKEANDEEKIQMSGNRPAGFSHTMPRGTFQPMSRDMRYTSTRKHMYAASLRFEKVKEEDTDEIIDLTEAEEKEDNSKYEDRLNSRPTMSEGRLTISNGRPTISEGRPTLYTFAEVGRNEEDPNGYNTNDRAEDDEVEEDPEEDPMEDEEAEDSGHSSDETYE